MTQLLTTKHGVYEYRDFGNGFAGHVPLPAAEGDPAMNWTGGRIPLSLWQDIVAFFQKSYAETKSETQVRLFYNPDTQQWRGGPVPQKYGTGMTATDLPNHHRYDELMSGYMQGGFIKFGTVHHHCSAGAFQSGVDHKDEKESGLHITVGSLGQPKHTIHARVSVMVPGSISADGTVTKATHAYYSADLSQWFELPEALPQWFTEPLNRAALEHLLTCPTDAPCPEGWMDLLIKEPVRHCPIVPSRFGGPLDYQHSAFAQGSHWKINQPATPATHRDWWEHEDGESVGGWEDVAAASHHGVGGVEGVDALNAEQEQSIMEAIDEITTKLAPSPAHFYGLVMAPHSVVLLDDEADALDKLCDLATKYRLDVRDLIDLYV